MWCLRYGIIHTGASDYNIQSRPLVRSPVLSKANITEPAKNGSDSFSLESLESVPLLEPIPTINID